VSEYTITITPRGVGADGDSAETGPQTTVRVDTTGGAARVVELSIRAAEGTGLLSGALPAVDLDMLVRALTPSTTPMITASAQTPPADAPAAETPAAETPSAEAPATEVPVAEAAPEPVAAEVPEPVAVEKAEPARAAVEEERPTRKRAARKTVAKKAPTRKAAARKAPARKTAGPRVAAKKAAAKSAAAPSAAKAAPKRAAKAQRTERAAERAAKAAPKRAAKAQRAEGGGRPYRRMPEASDVLAVYTQAGSVTALADHFAVPRHTAQAWISRLRRLGQVPDKSR